VHGALRCLALIAGDLDEASLPRVVPVLFPELYALVTAVTQGSAPPGCGASLARRALAVLHACLGTLAYLGGAAAASARELVAPYTPLWLDACARVLGEPLQPGSAAACGLQIEALKVITRLLLSFPAAGSGAGSSAGADAARALGAVWALLSRSHGAYVTHVVNGVDVSSGGGGDDDGDVDSDGEELSLEALVAQQLELLLSLAGHRRFRSSVESVVPSLVPLTLGLMQLTATQAEEWAADPAAFAADEEEDCASARAVAEMLLDELLAELPEVTAPALAAAVHAGMAPGVAWKAREAALFAAGSVAERLLEPGSRSRRTGPDAAAVVTDIVLRGELSPASAPSPPLLAARALWACAKLARAAPAGVAAPLLDGVIAALGAGAHPVCRMASARAAAACVPLAPPAALAPRAHALHGALCGALHSALASPGDAADALAEPAMDALRCLVRADAHAAAAAAPALTPALLSLWSAHFNDPMLAPAAAGVLGALARVPAAVAPLHAATLPQLRALLCGGGAAQPGLLEAALELSHALLRRHAGDEAAHRAAHGALYGPAAALAAGADDAAVVAGAVTLLKDMLRAGNGAAAGWGLDGAGGGGDALSAALDAASRLLSPGVDDAAAACGGALLCALLRRAPAACAPLLPRIVAAAAARLRCASAASLDHTLAPALLLFFARLVHALGPAPFVDALSSITDPSVCGDDGSALVSVMRAWTLAQPDVHGAGAIRVSSTALAALLCCGHPALEGVTVQGEPLADEAAAASGGAIRTRSRARATGPQRFAAAALPAALMALVADAVLDEAEGASMDGGAFDGWGDDDDDDDDEEAEDDGGATQAALERAAAEAAAGGGAAADSLEALAGGGGAGFGVDDDDDDDADADDADDPLAATPIAPWVGAALRAVLADPSRAAALASLGATLNARRQRALQTAMAA
jgi:hypothetical protein